MRVPSLCILILFVLGASAVRTTLRTQSTSVFDIPQAVCAAEVLNQETVEVPAVIAAETEVTEAVTLTTTQVGGEELTVLLPSPSTYVEEAPLVVVTDNEGETYVVQALESYETQSGESIVVANIGGEAVTIEAEIQPTEVPLAPVVTAGGEVSVVEVSEVTEVEGEIVVIVATGNGETETIVGYPAAEITTEVSETLIATNPTVPSVIAESGEVTFANTVTTAVVGGEEYTAILPTESEGGAPLEIVTTGEGESVVVQVVESYETSTGESVVVANLGEGETVTFEGEIVTTEAPLAAVVTESGETSVVEVVGTCTDNNGSTVVVYVAPGGGIETIEAELVTEPTTEVPEELLETEEAEVECQNTIVTTDQTGETTVVPVEFLVETVTEVPSELITVPTIPNSIAESGELTYNSTVTTTTIGGEEYTVVLPSTSDLEEEAPLAVVTDDEGESYVVQVLESYETQSGENVVVANVGGDTVTIEAEIQPTEAPLASVVSEGELYVVEASEVTTNAEGETVLLVPTSNGETTVVTGEVVVSPYNEVSETLITTPEEYPAAIASEAEVTNSETLVTSTVIGEEEYTVLLPSPETYEEQAPLEPIVDSEGETYVVQVVESYESESGESTVVANIGGETITIEAEIVPVSVPLATVVSDGETYVVEVSEVTTTPSGETVVLVPSGNGEVDQFVAEVTSEPVTEIPTELVAPEELPAVVSAETEGSETETTVTTTVIGGEEYTVLLPSPETYDEQAPLEPIVDSEGETYVVQVVESYESESGESTVVANIGGETITIEAEIVPTEVPLATIVTNGETSVVEVSEVTTTPEGETIVLVPTGNGEVEQVVAEVTSEPVTEIPTELIVPAEELPAVVSAETEGSETETTVTTTVIGGEEYTVLLPSPETYEEQAPLEPIVDSEGETYVVQVVESYESESGESTVVANIGGETITIEAEIVPTEVPLATIVTNGETSVVEVSEVTTTPEGETIVLVPTGNGEVEQVVAEVTSEPVTEIPTELIVPAEELPAVVSAETEGSETETTVTTTVIGGEEYTVLLPSPETYEEQAPLEPIVDSEGETYVVQVVESYESESGESTVVANIGGETITIEAEIVPVSVPLATVVSDGETYVVEVSEVTTTPSGETVVLVPSGNGEVDQFVAEVTSEPVTEIPTELVAPEELPAVVSAETEGSETETTVTTTVIGGEEYTVLLPSPETYDEQAPLEPIVDSEGETYVVQVVESYESESGESTVVANIGGETITIEAEIVPTEVPLATIVTNGETSVVEVSEVTTTPEGETIVLVPTGNGEVEQVVAEVTSEPVTEIPTELIVPAEELPAVVSAETEGSETETTVTTTVIGGEEYTVLLPSPETYEEQAPLEPIVDSEGETYVVQVVESYESESGESTVVANIGGETITIEAEIVPTEVPLATIVTNGETSVVEVSEVTTTPEGETIVLVPTGNGEVEQVVAEVTSEPVTEIPTELIVPAEELPAVVSAETEGSETETTVTTTVIGGEEYTVLLPSPETYEEQAPLEPIVDSEGETYVVQVVESYESESGESTVVANIGGETITIEAEIVPVSVPLATVVSDGETYVVEVSEVTTTPSGETVVLVPSGNGEVDQFVAEVTSEPVTEIPTELIVPAEELPAVVSAETEGSETETTVTTTVIGGEEYTVLLPSPETYEEQAPLEPIVDSEGETYVVQVVESYESESGESTVVANIGGETITIEAEIVPVSVPLATVVSDGETYVVEVSEVTTTPSGETVVLVPSGNGEVDQFVAEVTSEPVTEIPTELVAPEEEEPAFCS